MGKNNRIDEADELTEKIKRDKLRRKRQAEEEEEEQENSKRRTSRAETEEAGDNPENQRREEEERRQREKEKKEEEENQDEDEQNDEDKENEQEGQDDEGKENDEDEQNDDSSPKDEKNHNDRQSNDNNKETNNNKEGKDEKSSSNSNKSDNTKGDTTQGKNSLKKEGGSSKTNTPGNNSQGPVRKPSGQGPAQGIGKDAGKQVGQEASKRAGQEAGKKAAEQAAKQASKTAAKAGTKVALGPILFWVGIIILIIIVVVGILFFFITMPGMVVGKIGDAINGLTHNIQNYFAGSEEAIDSVMYKDVLSVAKYIENMGYDLQGYGFLSEEAVTKVSGQVDDGKVFGWWHATDSVLEKDGENYIDAESDHLKIAKFSKENYKERTTDGFGDEPQVMEVYLKKDDTGWLYDSIPDVYDADIYNVNGYYADSYNLNSYDPQIYNVFYEDQIKKNIVMLKDQNGEVTYVKSKYLAMYIAAENAIYLARNDNTSFWQRFLKLFGANNPNKGSGMITFINESDRDIKYYIGNADDYNKYGKGRLKFVDPEGKFGSNRYKIDKATRSLIIYNDDDGWFKSSQYEYNIDKYITKYRNSNSTLFGATFIKYGT